MADPRYSRLLNVWKPAVLADEGDTSRWLKLFAAIEVFEGGGWGRVVLAASLLTAWCRAPRARLSGLIDPGTLCPAVSETDNTTPLQRPLGVEVTAGQQPAPDARAEGDTDIHMSVGQGTVVADDGLQRAQSNAEI